MITKEKFSIYKDYRGDIDGWARSGKESDRIISDDDWLRIDDLLLRLSAVKKKQASESFTTETMQRLKEEVPDDSVAKELMSLA